MGHVVAGYALFGGLWIALSDRAVGLLTTDPDTLVRLSTWKGLAFILLTSGLLWALVTRYARSLAASQATLQTSERRLRSYLEHAPTAIFVADREGHYLDANPAALALVGYPLESLRKLTVRDLVPPTGLPLADRSFSQLKREGQMSREVDLRRHDGTTVPVALRAVALPDGTLMAMCTDNTARRAQIRELTEARDAAEAGRRAKDEFLATMSHELRTPLNGVIGMAQVLAFSKLDPAQQADLATLSQSARDVLGLVDDVLDYARLEAGRVAQTPVDFEPYPLFEELLAEQVEPAARKGLRLSLEVAPEVPAHVQGDRAHLARVMQHLLANAVKFTKTGGVSVFVRAGERHGGAVLLKVEVQDTGMGMASEVLQRIFTPFLQGDGSRSRSYGGTGLGLSICHRLARLMDAQLWAESEPDEGSTFHFVVPVTVATDLASPRATTPSGLRHAAAVEGHAPGLRVLVAEDHSVNRRYVEAALRRLGHHATLVKDGLEAVAALQRQPFDVVLLDLQMPLMSGADVLRVVRRLEAGTAAHLPVIAVTGWATERPREAWLAEGFDGLLPKPFDVPRLVRELDACRAPKA